jgi:hypothetical protein
VENQVGLVRERIFTPRIKCASLVELNELLARKCWELAAKLPHPEQPDRSRLDVFERDEKPALMPLSSIFDGFTERECRVSATSLVHYDRNRYSVDCRYAEDCIGQSLCSSHGHGRRRPDCGRTRP